MKVINSLLGLILIRIRYYNKKDPFKIFKKMMKKSTLPIASSDKKKSILIAPVRVSPMSNLFEGLLAYFYKLRGYEVSTIMCDKSVRYCDNISFYDKNKFLSCTICLKEQKRFCNTFKVKKLSIRNVLNTENYQSINNEITNRNFCSDQDFVYNGIDLKNDIIAGVMRYTLKSDISKDTRYIKEFARTSFIFSTALLKIMQSGSYNKLILSHGIYSTWGSLLSTAKKINLKSIVWGRGYVGQGNLLFGHNMNYHEEFACENGENFRHLPLSEVQIKRINQYFANKEEPNVNDLDYVNYYKGIRNSNFDEVNFWKEVNSYKRKFGMYTNIPWDGQVFNKTEGFPDTKTYVIAVVEWFKYNPQCCLIIRAHPAEKTGNEAKVSETFSELLFSLYPELPNNVYFLEPDNPISSYKLAKKVDCSILYGSSLSLEFAIMGYTVIQTGNFNVSNKGIVFEPKSRSCLHRLMDKAEKGNLKASNLMRQNSLRYGYYWVYKRHIKDTTVNLKNLIFKSYSFTNEEGFIQDKTLNLIFEKIENDKPIILD